MSGTGKENAAASYMEAVLKEHEVRTNLVMCNVLIVFVVISFVMALLLKFSVISYDFSTILVPCHTLMVLFLTAVVLAVFITGGENRFDKYLIVFSLIVFSVMVNTYYISLYLIYALPLIICVAYRDKTLTATASVLSLLAAAAGVVLSVFNNYIDLNYVDFGTFADGSIIITSSKEEIIGTMLTTSYLVFAVPFAVIAGIAYATTAKGLKIMEQKAAVDQKESALEKELNLASEIQKGMIPADSFADRYSAVTASMKTAKVVGGDYYDYFMTDESHIAVLIADVSGKGVPASLFMATAKTMMHSFAMRGQSPADVFDSVNRSLCESNPERMFVTAWMGILDLENGRLAYANAGHNPPVIIRADGTAEKMECRPGFILANRKNIRYKNYHTDMAAGDRVFLYTDGVTEAMDKDGNMFTFGRLVSVLSGTGGISSAEVLGRVRDSVEGFAGDAEQSDDMTMLILEYREKYVCENDPGRSFILNSGTYPEVMSYIRSELRSKGCLDKVVRDFEICSSEILSNIDLYAYSGRGDGEVGISVNVSNRRVRVIFTDSGPEYNPLEHSSPDSEKRISEHKIGGFGILVVRKTMDDVVYERKDGKNILTLKKEF